MFVCLMSKAPDAGDKRWTTNGRKDTELLNNEKCSETSAADVERRATDRRTARSSDSCLVRLHPGQRQETTTRRSSDADIRPVGVRRRGLRPRQRNDDDDGEHVLASDPDRTVRRPRTPLADRVQRRSAALSQWRTTRH